MTTPVTRTQDQTERWYVIDASGRVLGRLATQVATLLRGKDRPDFSPHLPGQTHVIVINAEKITVTGQKLDQKRYYRHGRVPGSLRSRTLREQQARDPRVPVERAILGMLPKNRLRGVWQNHLHVYAGADHPHANHKPEPVGAAS